MQSIFRILVALCVAGAMYFVWTQHRDIQRLTTERDDARGMLDDRVKTQDAAVALAVERARESDSLKLKQAKEVIDALDEKNKLASADLAAVRDRLRKQLTPTSSGGPDRGGVPEAGPNACKPDKDADARLLAARGVLIDQILELAADADAVVRERNALIETR